MRFVYSVLLVVSVVGTVVGQATFAGSWVVTTEFKQFNTTETQTLQFRAGRRNLPNGTSEEGFQASRDRSDLGPGKTNEYFVRIAGQKLKWIVDGDEVCDADIKSTDSFQGTCKLLGVAGTIVGRKAK